MKLNIAIFLSMIMVCICDVEVRKSMKDDGNGIYSIEINYRIQTSSDPTNLQIIDSYPEQLKLVEGDFVQEVKASTTWQTLSYKLALNLDAHSLSLSNKTVNVRLAPVRVFFGSDSFVESSEINFEVNPMNSILPKGGWIPFGSAFQHLFVAFFTLILPVLAAYVIIGGASRVFGPKKQQ